MYITQLDVCATASALGPSCNRATGPSRVRGAQKALGPPKATCSVLQTRPCKNLSRGKPRPPHRARQLVSASRARRGAHARGRLHGVRGHGAGIRRPRRRDRLAAAPRAALPAAARVRTAESGPAGVGRRPSFQRHLPRAPHGVAPSRRRSGAQTAVWPGLLAGARPRSAAVGVVARRRAFRRSVRHAYEDTPRARRRDLRRRHRDGPVRQLAGSDAGRSARSGVGLEAAAEQRAAAGGCAARARHRARRDRPRRPRDGSRSPPGRPQGRRRAPGRRRDGMDGVERRASQSVQRPDRAAPPVHVGPRRSLRSSRRSRTRSAARSTTSCSQSSAARSATTCASTAIRPTSP